MSRAKKTANGRPMNLRRETGYKVDLEHLARLRRATFEDQRISTSQYRKIHESTWAIEEILRPLGAKKKRK